MGCLLLFLSVLINKKFHKLDVEFGLRCVQNMFNSVSSKEVRESV